MSQEKPGGPAVDIDRDIPDVITDLASAGSMTTGHFDPKVELEKFEAAAVLLKKLIPATIKLTRPQDWVRMGSGDKAVVYLQATGVERVAPLWGLVFGEPKIELIEFDDGEFEFVVKGPIACRRTNVPYQMVVGGRSSADRFFDSFEERRPGKWDDMSKEEKAQWRMENRIRPTHLEVRKAAVTNWSTRGASMLMGMRGLMPADLKAAGITGIRGIEFGTGAQGGDATPFELKTERTKLENELLKRTSGDVDAACGLLKDITKGKDFNGFSDINRMTKGWQFKIAWEKLPAHKMFGDSTSDPEAGREPGAEG